jgi:hypothetical protein
MHKMIWLSYDLGVKGDYEGLYAWLDDHDAEECGNNVACLLHYEYRTALLSELKDDLSRNINLGKRDRIYIIWHEKQKMKGRFLFGKRKSAPWTGFGSKEPQVDEEG